MSSIALIPLASAAAAGLARGAADVVNGGLSFAAELIRGNNDTPQAHGPSELEIAQQQLTEMIEQFAAQIRTLLSEGGIDLSEPIALESDGLGGVTIASNHPQRGAIENLLDGDVLVNREFDRLREAYDQLPLPPATVGTETRGDFHVLIGKDQASGPI